MGARVVISAIGIAVAASTLALSACGSSRGVGPRPTRLTKQAAKIVEGNQHYRVNYWQYLPPPSFRGKPAVLIFLHGFGARAVSNDSEELARVLVDGPPKLVEQGNTLCFSVRRRRTCFLMLAPQALPRHDWFSASVLPIVDAMINRAHDLAGDMNRVYLTGLSMGGIGTWSYAGGVELDKGGRIAGSRLAAIVPIAGSGDLSSACNIARAGVAVWAFHGKADDVVNPRGSIREVQAINACTHPHPQYMAILTLYPRVGHDAWTQTYDPASHFDPRTGHPNGRGVNIYQWLLMHRRPSGY